MTVPPPPGDDDPWAAPPIQGRGHPEEDPGPSPPDPGAPDGRLVEGPTGAPDPPRDPWAPQREPRAAARPAPGRPVDPWPPSFNTGVPASMPAEPAGWNANYPDQPGPGVDYPPVESHSPGYGGFAPADPAAVSGPPWPVLVAREPYTPPPLIAWPIFAGVGVAVAITVFAVVLSASGLSHRVSAATWLSAHVSTIKTLHDDQTAILANHSSQAALADWRKLYDDAIAAAGLPNPGGAATVPWREMLQDYVTGSGDVVQGLQTRNPSELQQAEAILAAGDAAARRFDVAMGITSP